MQLFLTMMCLRTFTSIALFLLVSGATCKNIDKYDHFTYTQQWPQSVCACPEESVYDESCRIPEDVKTWTIHGLWPTLGKSDKPQSCNNSWKFEENQILKIESQMRIYWPKLLFNSGSRISFWEHEWVKHGTCCTDLPRLNSEFNYFNEGLNLNQKFNLSSMLEKAEITPSRNTSYQLGEIRKAIQAGVSGFRPYIHCCKGDDSKQRIEEVMICLDAKTLIPIDCKRDDEKCNEDAPIYYEPIIPYDMNLHVLLTK